MTPGKVAPEIIERIRKCLSLGDRSKGATEAEAQTAISMAQKLMAQHNLSMSDVDFKKEVESGAKEATYEHGRSQLDEYEKRLARLMDTLFDVEHFLTDVYKKEEMIWRAGIKFVGVGVDPDVANAAYLSMLGTIRRMGAGTAYQGASKRHYMMGVIDGLISRAEQERRAEKQAAVKSREMVVTKGAVIKAQLAKYELKSCRASSVQPGINEYAHGIKDSAKVSLNFRKTIN